jgi:ATP-dependent RNA helicase DDX49/DBP8
MFASKRRTPTTDDLLRRQEEPRKRYKESLVIQGDEDEDDHAEDEGDFTWVSESENEAEESIDSETSNGSSPVESALLDESSNLLGSRVTTKPRHVQQRPLSSISGAGSSKSVTFASLDISPPLLSALSKMAIHAPTEIQRACIPPLLEGPFAPFCFSLLDCPLTFLKGRDCIGNAKTGSGKTIAFALPILQKLAADPYGIFALVLTPTRYRPLVFSFSFVSTITGSWHFRYRNNS